MTAAFALLGLLGLALFVGWGIVSGRAAAEAQRGPYARRVP